MEGGSVWSKFGGMSGAEAGIGKSHNSGRYLIAGEWDRFSFTFLFMIKNHSGGIKAITIMPG